MTTAQCKAAQRRIKNNPHYPNPPNYVKARQRDAALAVKQRDMQQRNANKNKNKK